MGYNDLNEEIYFFTGHQVYRMSITFKYNIYFDRYINYIISYYLSLL